MRLLTISILLFLSSAIFAQNFDWTPQNSGVTTSLNDVYFTDNQMGWAVGDNGVIITTKNGGQSWISRTSGTTEKLRAVFFADDNTGWAVGGVNTEVLLKTYDGGLTWQNLNPSNIVNAQFLDVAFADVNTGWIITWGRIYLTSDGGTTWSGETYLSGVEQVSHRAIAVTSDSTAYVAGQSKRGIPSSPYADVFNRRPFEAPNSWGGSALTQFQTDDKLRSIAFSSPNTGFAGGQNGIIYKLEQIDSVHLNGPWNINLDLNPSGLQFIRSISFPSETNGMFLTSADVSGTSYALIYHTSDTGDTWSAAPDSIQDLLANTLHAPDTSNAWIVGIGGKIYKGVRKPTGITQMRLNIDVSIYPNPATELINIELASKKSNELISYTLLDVNGRVIENGTWSLNSSNARFTLNLSDVIKGMYLLKLSSEDGQSTFRVFKK